MELLTKQNANVVKRPVKVLQFGEGNFLRAFVDYMIDITNEKGLFDGSIVLVKPITFGNLDAFHAQDCRYTVSLRGIVDGKAQEMNRIIDSVSDAVDAYGEYEKYAAYAKEETLRFIVSNTTEAGICFDDKDKLEDMPPNTFPAKLTKFLYERYTFFKGDRSKGLVMLPVELIDDNGIELKRCVMKYVELWSLEADFAAWLDEACVFCSTLVDRIVTGYPRDNVEEFWERFGYEDRLVVTGEPFALWVIESQKDISEEFPLPKAGLPVIFTDNQKPYKQRKVRILNGAHTSFVLASYLAGNDFVKESMDDEEIFDFIQKTVYEEIIPTLTLPKEELVDFADSVMIRFRNPYVKHALLSISLNSVSKWRARCMPSLLGYVEGQKALPAHLTFSLAALIAFYCGKKNAEGALMAVRGNNEYRIMDDEDVLTFFDANSDKDAATLANLVLSNEAFWGCDLTKVEGLEAAVAAYLADIKENGMRAAMKNI